MVASAPQAKPRISRGCEDGQPSDSSMMTMGTSTDARTTQ